MADYPKNWNHIRKKVYRRDEFACANCGAKGGPYGSANLEAHHIVPKSQGGTHKLSNLKTLCGDCHNATHGDSIAPTKRNGSSGVSDRKITPTGECSMCNTTNVRNTCSHTGCNRRLCQKHTYGCSHCDDVFCSEHNETEVHSSVRERGSISPTGPCSMCETTNVRNSCSHKRCNRRICMKHTHNCSDCNQDFCEIHNKVQQHTCSP